MPINELAHAKAANEAALAIIHDVVFDVAIGAGTDAISADPNDYTISVDGPRGSSAITFVPGVEPGSIDVVIVAANGATVRIRGRAFVRS